MSKKKIDKRARVKTFVKYVNLNHLMPTRYIEEEKLIYQNYEFSATREVYIYEFVMIVITLH